MRTRLILASGSETRQALLRNAGVVFESEKPRVDEALLKASLLAEDRSPRDIADALAEMKAARVADKHPGAMVIGADQTLDHGGRLLSKPETADDAATQISALSGSRHILWSAVVLFDDGKPVWRHIGQVRLQMRELSAGYIHDYVARNWDSIRHSVGGYKLEEEGVRLFSHIDGSYFDVLGFPLIEVLSYLSLRGEIET
ncbi:MAG: Maf family protein [Pseudomonadota bacterium]